MLWLAVAMRIDVGEWMFVRDFCDWLLFRGNWRGEFMREIFVRVCDIESEELFCDKMVWCEI